MAAPVIVTVQYASAVTNLSWIGSGIGPTTSCTVTLTDGVGTQYPYPETGTSAAIGRDLTQNGPWSVTVNAVGGLLSQSMPIITASVTATTVENTGAGLSANWNTAPAPYNLYFASLSNNNSGYNNGQFASTTNTVFNVPLTGTGWQFQISICVQQGGGTSYGPPTPYTPILVAPQMLTVDYDGTDTSLEWLPVTGYKYLARLFQPPNTPLTQSTTSTNYDFPGAVSGTGWKANVSLQSTDGILIGPPSQTYLLILAAPVMSSVNYTVDQILLVWNSVPPYTYYAAEVYTTGDSQSQTVQATQHAFLGQLLGTGWQATARALSDDQVSIGPPSGPYTVILNSPSFTELDYDAAVLSVSLTGATDPSVTGNLLQLTSSGGEQSFPLSTSPNQNVNVNLSALLTYTAMLRATNGIVLGPWSQALVAISASPANAYLGLKGANLEGLWKQMQQSQVTGYLAALSEDGSVIQTLPATGGSVSFTQALTQGKVFTIQVRGTGSQVKGPWSTPIPGPYAAAWVFVYDAWGHVKTLTWNGTQQQQWTYDNAGNVLTCG